MVTYCAECTTAYAPELDHCPHCGSTDTATEEDTMPKITKHGGPSDATTAALETPTDTELGDVQADTSPDDGDHSEPATATGARYGTWSYAELQAECKERGLPAGGARGLLIDALRVNDKNVN